MITKITVQTKKGAEQETTWDIKKSRVYPTIGGMRRLEWQNGEGVFPRYGREPGGLDSIFYAMLLRSDYDPGKATRTRRDAAGFAGNPGAITYRGNSLDEISINIDVRKTGAWPDIQVRGFGRPTPSERKFIEEQIIPGLLDFIDENETALYWGAICALRDQMRGNIGAARTDLDVLEREADRIIARLCTLHLHDDGS